jgi:hypothetical protein
MAERFSDIEKPFLINQRSLEERLKAYPELKAKIEAMLAIIENAGGDVEKAAEAERRIIEELRQMGNEVLHSWARRQQEKKEEEYNAQPGVNRKEKNLYWYTRLGKIEIEEQIFTQGRQGPQIRPFYQSAEVHRDSHFWRDSGKRGGSGRAAGGLRSGGGSGKPDQDPRSG